MANRSKAKSARADKAQSPKRPAATKPFRLGQECTAPAMNEGELGATLLSIADDLELARAVAASAWQALENMNACESSDIAPVLKAYVDNPLCECVTKLQEAVEHARLQGGKLVIAKEAQS